ncbi:MAG: hypothetical protein AB7F40_05315 [Victivallaceae bacterium]|nr:hypothetical protein [Victivallaceae bacterium]
MKKWLLPVIATAFIATGCRSYNSNAPTVEPSQKVEIGEWGAQAEYYFDVRDLDKAKSAIEEYVRNNNGRIVYVSQQENQYVMSFVVLAGKFNQIDDKLLKNSSLTYYVRADQTDNGKPNAEYIQVTVVMNRTRIPGPLTVALWIPAKLLESLVWLN